VKNSFFDVSELDKAGKKDENRLQKKHSGGVLRPWNQRKRFYSRPRFTLRLANTRLCVRSAAPEPTVKKSSLILVPCLRGTDFLWGLTDRSELILADLLCLDSGGATPPRLMKCHELGGEQEWKVRKNDDQRTAIYNMAAGLCLAVDSTTPSAGEQLTMQVCSEDKSYEWEVLEMSDEDGREL